MIGKSSNQVAAVIGVLAAGAAYLPIDPSLPALRIRELLRQSEVAAILVDPAHAPLTDLTDAPFVVVDEAIENDAAAPSVGPSASGDLAYVIYTSGSTGPPKG
jgi:non-ribosomal peptide synthetase component F